MFTTPFTFMEGFNPQNISNLIRWWKSNAGVAQSGGYITTWTDQVSSVVATAGSSTNFTLSNPLNGYNGIQSPSDNSISMSLSSSINLSPFTIFAVVERSGTKNPQYLGGSSSSQGIGLAYDDGSGYKPFIYDGSTSMIFQGGSSPINDPVYTTWGLSTSTGFIRQNGTEVATNSGNPNSQGFDRLWENTAEGNRTFQGTIWEILIYTRILNNTEITDVESYLSKKYRL